MYYSVLPLRPGLKVVLELPYRRVAHNFSLSHLLLFLFVPYPSSSLSCLLFLSRSFPTSLSLLLCALFLSYFVLILLSLLHSFHVSAIPSVLHPPLRSPLFITPCCPSLSFLFSSPLSFPSPPPHRSYKGVSTSGG